MDKTRVVLLLCWIGCCAGLKVSILGPPERMLKAGNEMNLVCHLTMGLEVILHYKVHWIHVPVSGAEQILTEQQSVTPGNDAEHYGVKVTYADGKTNVTLTVSKAKFSQDGRFICRANAIKAGDPSPEAEVKVLVPSNVQNLVLIFDGEQTSLDTDVTSEREEGEFPVTCQASGFNPSAEVSLFLGGQKLESGVPAVSEDVAAQDAAGAPRFQSTVSVPKLKLDAKKNSGKVLRCMARADFDGATPMQASMPLKIIALVPEIFCEKNSSSRPGNKYVHLKCRVQHQRVDVDHYSFEIGYTGEIVNAVNDSQSNHQVIVKPVKGLEATDDVSLVLYEVKDEHFDTFYYLDVFLTNGQRFRATAKLILQDTYGAASKPTAYAVCLFLLSLLVWSL